MVNVSTVVQSKILQKQGFLMHTTVQFIVRVVLTVLVLAVTFGVFFLVYLPLLTRFQRGTCIASSDLISINNNVTC